MKHGTVEFGLAGSVSGNCSFVDANVEAGCALMTDRFRSSMPGRRGKDIGGAGIGHVHRYGKLRTWISERGDGPCRPATNARWWRPVGTAPWYEAAGGLVWVLAAFDRRA